MQHTFTSSQHFAREQTTRCVNSLTRAYTERQTRAVEEKMGVDEKGVPLSALSDIPLAELTVFLSHLFFCFACLYNAVFRVI